MQFNASFPTGIYYGRGYELPMANVAIQAASNASNTTNFAFPQRLPSLPDPFFNFGFLDAPPGPWTTNALPALMRSPAREESILPRPVLTRDVQKSHDRRTATKTFTQ